MTIPLNILMWAMAFLPVAVLLVLMLGFRWSVTKASVAGLIITVVTGFIFYKADGLLIAIGVGKGLWNALNILLIIWTAILLYQVGNESNAYAVIRDGLHRFLPNELLQVLAMSWVFVSFLQGISGFGVPVAVGAPLLMGIGVAPLWSVVLPLLGQSWGNTFGTLGAAWDSLVMATGLIEGSSDYLAAAVWAAVFIAFWNLIAGIAICWFYGRGKALRKGLPAVLAIAVVQGVGEILLGTVNTTLCCFVPAVLSLFVIIALGRTPFYNEEWRLDDSPIMSRKGEKSSDAEEVSDMSLFQAFIPYILLSVLSLAVLLITPVNDFLGKVQLGFSFPQTTTGYGYVTEAVNSFSPLAVFTHASMFLFVSSIVSLVYYRRHGWIKKGGTGNVFHNSVTMSMPSVTAVIGLVVMSQIMSTSGQTVILAEGIANVLGNAYVIFTPFVGMLGTFMTGSNMNSNILFGSFQKTIATILGIDEAPILAAQTVGGTIGSTFAPSKIILGTTTADILGQEGEVMKKVLPIAVAGLTAIGLVLLILNMV